MARKERRNRRRGGWNGDHKPLHERDRSGHRDEDRLALVLRHFGEHVKYDAFEDECQRVDRRVNGVRIQLKMSYNWDDPFTTKARLDLIRSGIVPVFMSRALLAAAVNDGRLKDKEAAEAVHDFYCRQVGLFGRLAQKAWNRGRVSLEEVREAEGKLWSYP